MVHKCQAFADLLYASYSGLQTLAKWLKDRKGRKLSDADISHYKRIVRAHTGCEAFNLGTGIGYSVLDIVSTFQKVNGIPVPYEITARRPGDIAVCYASPDKSREVLGWQAEKTLEDMCRDTWNWQKHNPQGYGE